jgi:hypothetical protein
MLVQAVAVMVLMAFDPAWHRDLAECAVRGVSSRGETAAGRRDRRRMWKS